MITELITEQVEDRLCVIIRSTTIKWRLCSQEVTRDFLFYLNEVMTGNEDPYETLLQRPYKHATD